MNEVYIVFVYGTLKTGCRPKTIVKGKLRDNGSYPSIKLQHKIGDKDSNADRIEVEICEVTKDQLAYWDRYEGVHRGLYNRVEVMAENNQVGYIYVGNESWLHADRKVLPDCDGIVRWRR